MQFLRKSGGLWLKLRDSSVGVSEWSDIIGCYHGVFVAIELKVPGRKPRPGQFAFLKIVKLAGGVSGYATSIKEVREILKEVEERKDAGKWEIQKTGK